METPTLPPADLSFPQPVTPQAHGFSFAGSGNEYFRIWITNLLLSIVTLGIYSAWAKVRREQYFHRNTLLDRSGFDYHGQPWAILKGRFIAWTLVLLLAVVNNTVPQLYLVALLVLSPLLPWLIVRSFIFRARNTSYRGLRFDFDGTYKEAAKIILGWGLLAMLTFGLTFPILMQRFKAFQLNHLSYGGERFRMRADIGSFYLVFLLASLVVIVPLMVMGVLILIAVIVAGIGGDFKETASGILIGIAVGMVVLAYLASLLIVQPFLQVRLANLVWNNTHCGPHAFASQQKMRSLFPIFLANWLLIVLTLGLYWPWAQVKLAKYRAEHTALVASGSLDDFVGQAVQNEKAIGEEIADAFDFDIAL